MIDDCRLVIKVPEVSKVSEEPEEKNFHHQGLEGAQGRNKIQEDFF